MGRCAASVCVFDRPDRDGDGYVDAACDGPDCNDSNETVYPGAPEVCDDGGDNDCNGVADCFDPSCGSTPDCGCSAPIAEVCNNAIDDDCDDEVDCNDADCVGASDCGCSPESCGNGEDDDLGAAQSHDGRHLCTSHRAPSPTEANLDQD